MSAPAPSPFWYLRQFPRLERWSLPARIDVTGLKEHTGEVTIGLLKKGIGRRLVYCAVILDKGIKEGEVSDELGRYWRFRYEGLIENVSEGVEE